MDPKSVLCAFFKQGMCHKGAKCKFSHDLAVEQKAVKKNLYVDSRDLKDGEEGKFFEVLETFSMSTFLLSFSPFRNYGELGRR